eukprot:531293-Rhodomonas_salina.3
MQQKRQHEPVRYRRASSSSPSPTAEPIHRSSTNRRPPKPSSVGEVAESRCWEQEPSGELEHGAGHERRSAMGSTKHHGCTRCPR